VANISSRRTGVNFRRSRRAIDNRLVANIRRRTVNLLVAILGGVVNILMSSIRIRMSNIGRRMSNIRIRMSNI
jgi:hypothetical protein